MEGPGGQATRIALAAVQPMTKRTDTTLAILIYLTTAATNIALANLWIRHLIWEAQKPHDTATWEPNHR